MDTYEILCWWGPHVRVLSASAAENPAEAGAQLRPRELRWPLMGTFQKRQAPQVLHLPSVTLILAPFAHVGVFRACLRLR